MTNSIRNFVKVSIAIVVAVIFCSAIPANIDSKRIDIPALGFSMLNPEGWIIQNKQSFQENLNKYEFDRQDLQTLISDHKNSLPISTVTKYHPMDADGILPTINVIGRNNPLTDETTFLRSVNMSAHMLKRMSYDFTMTQKPEFRTVGNAQAVYFSSEYKLKMTDGTMVPCRNQTIAIPNGDFVIQISMIDKPSDLCDETFTTFLNDLKVTSME